MDVNPTEVQKLAELEDHGYLLEVDVRYPTKLHDSHNELPFMCEKMDQMGLRNWCLILTTKQNM